MIRAESTRAACRLHPSDWAIRWQLEQGGGALDPFDALGGQLWGSRLSLFHLRGQRAEPYCDALLFVVRVFGTAKVNSRIAPPKP